MTGCSAEEYNGAAGRDRAYCAALEGALSLECWRRICERAVRDTMAGDAPAREWLSALLLGDEDEQARRGAGATGGVE
jgi:hypothetical protein